MRKGRPVVQLQDLVVALRAFPPGREGASTDLLLDRSDAGRPGGHAAVPAERRHDVPGPGPGTGDRRPARRGPAEQPGDAERDDHRRLDQDPFRPGARRGRLPDEADRHRAGAAARPHDDLHRPRQSEPGGPQRPVPLVLRPRLQLRPRERGRPGHGTGRRRREAGGRR